MSQRPNAISLMLCDQVVFEQGTQKPYLLGVFTGVQVPNFPSPLQRFDVFAALTDGMGDVTITLQVTDLETDRVIYEQTMQLRFSDPLQIVNVRYRVRMLIYKNDGVYLFALVAGGEEIASRRISVHEAGANP